MNVNMAKKYGMFPTNLKFDLSWKHIVVGFYHEINEKNNNIYKPNIISI